MQENVQVPNSGENAHSSVLSEKVSEERTYRNLRGNPRFMYANVRDSPMLTSYFADYSTKLILLRLQWVTLSRLLKRPSGLLL